ncbi:MAG: alpha/beta hydrolase [Oscillospiraceae bacterium]|nr:alpha/beta hydrolase [Oscillospiraceae bacterium]
MSWKQIEMPNGATNIFCNAYITGKTAMNIIVTHTPICSATLLQPALEPLTKHHVNIFHFDFSATGQSEGTDFSVKTTVSDMNLVIDYISKNFSDNIHLLGYTGIGGIFAQYAVHAGIDARIKSFAQFACVIHKDPSPMEKPIWLLKIMYGVAKIFPNVKITFDVPKFVGFNADKDNAFYEELEKMAPGSMRTKLKLMSTMIGSAIFDNSVMQKPIKCPTLVFKVLHDRYFPAEYFDKYYATLKCEKKLVEINDAHNSYYYNAELFCEPAYEWFAAHSDAAK